MIPLLVFYSCFALLYFILGVVKAVDEYLQGNDYISFWMVVIVGLTVVLAALLWPLLPFYIYKRAMEQ